MSSFYGYIHDLRTKTEFICMNIGSFFLFPNAHGPMNFFDTTPVKLLIQNILNILKLEKLGWYHPFILGKTSVGQFLFL